MNEAHGPTPDHGAVSSHRPSRLLWVLVAALICAGSYRIYLTYAVYSQTWDEPAHIAAGMQWWVEGRYTYERFHPPLARVMSALPLYATGVRGMGHANMWEEGDAILQANDDYETNLTKARLGVLPFFIVGAVVVAIWAHSFGGALPSILGVLLFTTLPPVLAHAGVATLDMAAAAFFVAALHSLQRWLRQPSSKVSVRLGVFVGLMTLTKFSALAFFLASAAIMLGLHAIFASAGRPSIRSAVQAIRAWIMPSVFAGAACALVVWAGYRFSVHGRLRIPAPDFVLGFMDVFSRNDGGHLVFFLGQIGTEGWWHFYPIMLMVKTPIPFLILAGVGVAFVLFEAASSDTKVRRLAPLAGIVGVVAIGMVSSVHNGLRQVLAVYPLAAVLAGYGAWRLVQVARRGRLRIGVWVVALLMAWQVGVSLAAHPDYLPYFNAFARGQPERIVGDSDLDWGQDLWRLSDRAEELGIEFLHVSYNGSWAMDLDDFDLPPWQALEPYDEVSGWVAISVRHLHLGTRMPPYDQFAWLWDLEPVEVVGRSIYLYCLESPACPSPRPD